jgi:hypothetical protein
MRRRSMLTVLAATALAGCASAPQLVRDGDAAFARGRTLALSPSQAEPLDHALDGQAAALVMARLGAQNARIGDPAHADYLVQVSLGAVPAGVGVQRPADAAAQPAWLAAPTRARLFARPGPAAYSLTVVAIDAHSGKAAFTATATAPARGDVRRVLARLVDTALPPATP